MSDLDLFIRESNWIEGEREIVDPTGGGAHVRGKLYDFDVEAGMIFLSNPLTEASLKALHYRLSEGRNILRGEYRDCEVTIGNHRPPNHKLVPALMGNFFLDLVGFDSHQAHIKFEKIHPFEDLNGRTGRLLWLHKYLEDGRYDIPQSFLQQFYYQTLTKGN